MALSRFQEGQKLVGKREKPENIVTKLRQVEVLQGQGMPIAARCGKMRLESVVVSKGCRVMCCGLRATVLPGKAAHNMKVTIRYASREGDFLFD